MYVVKGHCALFAAAERIAAQKYVFIMIVSVTAKTYKWWIGGVVYGRIVPIVVLHGTLAVIVPTLFSCIKTWKQVFVEIIWQQFVHRTYEYHLIREIGRVLAPGNVYRVGGAFGRMVHVQFAVVLVGHVKCSHYRVKSYWRVVREVGGVYVVPRECLIYYPAGIFHFSRSLGYLVIACVAVVTLHFPIAYLLVVTVNIYVFYRYRGHIEEQVVRQGAQSYSYAYAFCALEFGILYLACFIAVAEGDLSGGRRHLYTCARPLLINERRRQHDIVVARDKYGVTDIFLSDAI